MSCSSPENMIHEDERDDEYGKNQITCNL
jgi:hypothetical protein